MAHYTVTVIFTTFERLNLIMSTFHAGPTSSPYFTVEPVNLSSVDVVLQRPVYGWQCVDSYTVILQFNNVQTNSTIVVEYTTQLTFHFTFSELDLCKYNYSAVALASNTSSLPVKLHVNRSCKLPCNETLACSLIIWG